MKIRKIHYFIPLFIIAVSMLASYLLGFYRVLNFEVLRYHHVEMIEYVNNNPLMIPFMFMGYCAGTTILCMPDGPILSLLAGFLFPQPWCTLYLLIGLTVGASIVFLSLKRALSAIPQTWMSRWFKKVDSHFDKHVISYMLFLRLFPFFPFWLVNLIPALFTIRLRTYIWTTLVGTIPSALILTEAGKGFNAVFEADEIFRLESILTLDVQIILLSLAIFALLPMLLEKLRSKKKASF